MLSDILAVFVVTLTSLFLSNTYVHGLPTPPTLNYNRRQSSDDVSSSLRLSQHHPIPSIAYDLGGDISQMLIDDSNELSTINEHDDDQPSSKTTSLHLSNEPFDFYFHYSPSESSSRELLLENKNHDSEEQKQQHEQQQQQQEKRSSSSLSNASALLPTPFNINSAMGMEAYVDPSHADSVVNVSNLSESTRLAPSLVKLVQTNPFARAWLTLLLQKVMEEQSVPYIFKYGRRRKK